MNKFSNSHFTKKEIREIFNDIFQLQSTVYDKLNFKIEKTENFIYIDQVLISIFNVYREENPMERNREYFFRTFIKNFRNLIPKNEITQIFKRMDNFNFNGLIPLAKALPEIYKYLKSDYTENNISEFFYLNGLVDMRNNLKYNELFSMIYYFNPSEAALHLNYKNELEKEKEKEKEKENILNDSETLLSIIISIKNFISKFFKNKIPDFFNSMKATLNLNSFTKEISIDNFYNYLKENIYQIEFPKVILYKLDLDKDGKISLLDLEVNLNNFNYVDSIKYNFINKENRETSKIELCQTFNSDVIEKSDFKSITKKIKRNLLVSGISMKGFLKILDPSSTGFVTLSNFCKYVSNVYPLSETLKQSYFNYLDYYKTGLIDYKTFNVMFKEYESSEFCPKNEIGLNNELMILNIIVYVTK